MNLRLFLFLLGCGCALWGADGVCKPDVAALKQKYARPAAIPFPVDNAFNKERELLGRTLFFDPRLSGAGTVSCASCHNPAFGWDDGLPHSLGKPSARKTPTILNVAWGQRYFWDGRAASLEEQALGPIQSEGEMNLPLEKMVAVVRAIDAYGPLFARAYAGEAIDEKTVARAIATFERTIVSGQAPFDQWVAGDERAISESAKRGFVLFNGKAGCAACHAGWDLTDHDFHDIGTVDLDPGRGKYMPAESMQHAFKTPGLRNVATRSAYMHDGSLQTLEAVIEYYDGGGMCLRPSLSPRIRNLQLNDREKRDLLEFLRTLTSEDARVEIPRLPRR